MVLPQVLDDPGGAELGVLVREDLGESGGGTADDPGVAIQRAVGLAAPAALVDVPLDRGDAVGVWYSLRTRPIEVSLVSATWIGEPSVSKRPRASAVARVPASLRRCWIVSSASSIEGP
jgi:hypothetical protein